MENSNYQFKFTYILSIKLFKAIKNSLKNGNEALMQTQLKELFYDYGGGAMTYEDDGNENPGDWTANNIKGMIEMGNEGIDLLIKTFESFLQKGNLFSQIGIGNN